MGDWDVIKVISICVCIYRELEESSTMGCSNFNAEIIFGG